MSERADRTLCSVPRWMFSPECSTFSLTQPAIAIEALSEVRDLLTSLQNASFCDNASARPPSQEDQHEIPSAVCESATESSLARLGARGQRPGFQRLVAEVCTGEVGAVFCAEASRLAPKGRDWHHLIWLCGLAGAVPVDFDGVYDPNLVNDRLLRGMKGGDGGVRTESAAAAIAGRDSPKGSPG
jgi:hypothetical protein